MKPFQSLRFPGDINTQLEMIKYLLAHANVNSDWIVTGRQTGAQYQPFWRWNTEYIEALFTEMFSSLPFVHLHWTWLQNLASRTVVFSPLHFLRPPSFSLFSCICSERVFFWTDLCAAEADKSDRAIHNWERKIEANSLWQTGAQLHTLKSNTLTHTHTHMDSWPVLSSPSKLTILQQSQLGGSIERERAEKREGAERRG